MLARDLGIRAALIKGDRGIFKVCADGDVIYSKKECRDRFPADAEIVAMLRARTPAR